MCWKRVIGSGLALVLGWTLPVAAQPNVDVLIFGSSQARGVSIDACAALGYTWVWSQTEPFFLQQMRSQPWDLVIFEMPEDLVTQKNSVADLLENHVAKGGRLLINYNNLDEWPRLQKLMGVDDAIERLTPENVLPLTPRHASFAGFGLPAIGNAWVDSGDALVPASESDVVGEYPNGDGAIVVGNDSTTVANGFDWDSYGGSSSFVQFQIEYIMACRADFDQSTGFEVLDIFDFLAFQDAFIRQHPTANLVYDKAFDIFDFLAFQDAFVTGCAS